MTQSDGWSPRFKFQFAFCTSICSSSAAVLIQYVPGIPPVVKTVVAVATFSIALIALIYAVIRMPRRQSPMTSRELTILFPLYGLAVGMLTARAVLLLR